MCDIVMRAPHFAESAGLVERLRAHADRWLAPTTLPVADLQRLSERLLIDIGIDPNDMPRPSREEAARRYLRERGW